MKVADILRTLLFQIKNMIATWIVQFHWLDKKLFKKLLVLRNHVNTWNFISEPHWWKLLIFSEPCSSKLKTWLQLESFNFIDSIKSYSKDMASQGIFAWPSLTTWETFYLRATLMKVADILRTLLFQIGLWLQLESFNFVDSIKSYVKKLLVLRNHVNVWNFISEPHWWKLLTSQNNIFVKNHDCNLNRSISLTR